MEPGAYGVLSCAERACCGLFHGGDEDMGFRIDPLAALGAPLLLNETEAVFELRVGEQPITGAFSPAQLLGDLVQVDSGVPTHRVRVQLAKPRLLAESENDVDGRQTRCLNVRDLGKKAEGNPGLYGHLGGHGTHEHAPARTEHAIHHMECLLPDIDWMVSLPHWHADHRLVDQ